MTTPMPLIDIPYITPEILVSAPTGIDWSTIPPGDDITPAENMVEWWRMCNRATAKANGYCNQVLRATIDVELMRGPDRYVTTGPSAGGWSRTPYWLGSTTSNARLEMSRWPILQVTNVAVCPSNTWPRTFSTLPTGWFEPERPPIGIYNSAAPGNDAQGGQAIIVGPGYIDWCYGRNGYVIEVTYVNGWPHSSLTSAATAGSTVLTVNDVTGWAVTNYQGQQGATGEIRDSQGNQEVIHVTSSSATSGPGTLTISAPLVWNHDLATMITTMPESIEEACILFASAEALTRGATTTTIHDVGGHAQHTGGDIQGLNLEAELLLKPFRRTLLCRAVQLLLPVRLRLHPVKQQRRLGHHRHGIRLRQLSLRRKRLALLHRRRILQRKCWLTLKRIIRLLQRLLPLMISRILLRMVFRRLRLRCSVLLLPGRRRRKRSIIRRRRCLLILRRLIRFLLRPLRRRRRLRRRRLRKP